MLHFILYEKTESKLELRSEKEIPFRFAILILFQSLRCFFFICQFSSFWLFIISSQEGINIIWKYSSNFANEAFLVELIPLVESLATFLKTVISLEIFPFMTRCPTDSIFFHIRLPIWKSNFPGTRNCSDFLEVIFKSDMILRPLPLRTIYFQYFLKRFSTYHFYFLILNLGRWPPVKWYGTKCSKY